MVDINGVSEDFISLDVRLIERKKYNILSSEKKEQLLKDIFEGKITVREACVIGKVARRNIKNWIKLKNK